MTEVTANAQTGTGGEGPPDRGIARAEGVLSLPEARVMVGVGKEGPG